ncbi:MAG: RNA pseudouridine synthase [Epsilonproteobacteria bacterium]|nr:RNA pseudouridine synthase [Campylobacterota bacterium]
MATEKAYKLVAQQEGISNSQAKSMIDRGLVYVGNKKVMIARGEIDTKTVFRIQKIEKPQVIFENDDILVVDKPAFVNSDELERVFRGAKLLHRLDRETSGVLMFVKNDAFRQKAIKEFAQDKVYKEYIAWLEGHLGEPVRVEKPIVTTKKNNRATSNVSPKGKPAITEFYPDTISAKKTKAKIIIHHGRTHQIRVHARYIEHSIVGDEQYGGRRAKRVMLHAHKVKLLGMEFVSPEPKEFLVFQ